MLIKTTAQNGKAIYVNTDMVQVVAPDEEDPEMCMVNLAGCHPNEWFIFKEDLNTLVARIIHEQKRRFEK